MSPEAKRILKRAYEVIKDRENWTKGTEARDRKTRQEMFYGEASPETAQFCAVGALAWSRDTQGASFTGYEAALALLNSCAERQYKQPDRLPVMPIVAVNDRKGHAKVVEAFECALKKAEAA